MRIPLSLCRCAALLLLAWLPLTGAAQSAAPGLRPADYIVAIVNSEPVTNTEVRARMQRVARSMATRDGQVPAEAQLAREVMEQLIVERAQLQQARDSGVLVQDYAVEQAMEGVAQQNGMDKAALLARLREEGISAEQFAQELREQLTLQRLREREVEGRVRVSEADIDRYLAEESRSSNAQTTVNLGHILIAVPENAADAELAARQQRAQEALAAARANSDFAAVAREFSDAPDAASGGAMGLRPLSRYPQLFAQASAQAAAGSVIGPLRSGAGFHIIKVLEKSLAGVPSVVTQHHARHILLRPDEQNDEEAVAARLRELRQRVQSGQARFEDVARQYSQDGSARAGGDLGWVNPGQFVPEFEQVLQTLQPGEISAPVLSRFGVHLIQLIARREAALSAREQREMLRRVVRERKVEADYQTWLQELRARAYVEYREPPQ